MSYSSIPDVGVTKNVPEDGGELVITTIEEELANPLFISVQVSVKDKVDPTGNELDSNTKLTINDDEEEVDVEDVEERVTLTGSKDTAGKLIELSSTDQTAMTSSNPTPVPVDVAVAVPVVADDTTLASVTDAVRNSLFDGSILGVLTLDTIEVI